jgi:hypothetical protein
MQTFDGLVVQELIGEQTRVHGTRAYHGRPGEIESARNRPASERRMSRS